MSTTPSNPDDSLDDPIEREYIARMRARIAEGKARRLVREGNGTSNTCGDGSYGTAASATPSEAQAPPKDLRELGVTFVRSACEEEPAPAARTVAFPEDCLVGSIGDFAKIMSKGSEVPPEFFFAAGLTMVGAIASTKLTLSIRFDVEPRLYTVLLGGSGIVKKSTAMKQSIAFFNDLKVPEPPLISYGVASAEGLVSDLNKASGGRLVLGYDELRALVDKCNIKGSTLLSAVTSLFEQNKWHNTTKSARNSVHCDNAHLSIVGCCTEDTYKHIWSSASIGIGLVNRLFIVLSDGGSSESWPNEVIERNLQPIRDRIERQLVRLPVKFDPTGEAREAWDAWYKTPRSSTHATRLDTIGFRLLALIALTTDKTEIDAETVQVVCEILDYELKVRMLTDPIDADSVIARLEEAVRRNLSAKGKLTKNQLRRATNADKYGIWAFDQALKNLIGAKDIYEHYGSYALFPGRE
jgi:hypothetical protein